MASHYLHWGHGCCLLPPPLLLPEAPRSRSVPARARPDFAPTEAPPHAWAPPACAPAAPGPPMQRRGVLPISVARLLGGPAVASGQALQEKLAALCRALDREFEPFAMQHNKRLLGLFERLLGPVASRAAPWPSDLLRGITFTLDELRELGLPGLLGPASQLPAGAVAQLGEHHEPRHLQWEGAGRWRLRAPPEVRRLAPTSSPGGGGGDVEVTVLSQAVAGPLEDGTPEGRQRSLRLGTQLRVHRAEVVCLQGVDAEAACRALGCAYDHAPSSCDGEVEVAQSSSRRTPRRPAAVLWDRRRWSLIAHQEHCAGVAVELSCVQEPEITIRFVSLRPSVPDCCSPGPALETFVHGSAGGGGTATGGGAAPRVVVCADLGCIGGAEATALVPGLLGLRSAMARAPGGEVAAPRRRPKEAPLRPLWRPSVVLYSGMETTSMLVGHTEGYLATLSEAEAEQHFPAGRPALLLSFVLPPPSPSSVPAAGAAATCAADARARASAPSRGRGEG